MSIRVHPCSSRRTRRAVETLLSSRLSSRSSSLRGCLPAEVRHLAGRRSVPRCDDAMCGEEETVCRRIGIRCAGCGHFVWQRDKEAAAPVVRCYGRGGTCHGRHVPWGLLEKRATSAGREVWANIREQGVGRRVGRYAPTHLQRRAFKRWVRVRTHPTNCCCIGICCAGCSLFWQRDKEAAAPAARCYGRGGTCHGVCRKRGPRLRADGRGRIFGSSAYGRSAASGGSRGDPSRKNGHARSCSSGWRDCHICLRPGTRQDHLPDANRNRRQ